VEIIVAVVSAAAAVAASVISIISVSYAHKAVRAAQLQQLFQGFNLASSTTLEHPDLLRDVHGLDNELDQDEARRIAYLSVLLDAFQHYYGHEYRGNFNKMANDMIARPTFLNRILAVPANAPRWDAAKKIYYGDFDAAFISAIDRLLQHEQGA